MVWPFLPKNDLCIGCEERGDKREIKINAERHYIVWDEKEGVYRRECAECYDLRHGRPYERRKTTDSLLNSYDVVKSEEDDKITV